MMPVEWPLAAAVIPPSGAPAPAPETRLAQARARLRQRRSTLAAGTAATIDALWRDLAERIADALLMALPIEASARLERERDALLARFLSSPAVDRDDVAALLLRRADEQSADARGRWLDRLMTDPDPLVAAAAMEYLVARARRRDGDDRLAIDLDDLAAEPFAALAATMAAAARPLLPGGPARDKALAGAMRALTAAHDEGRRLDRTTEALAAALFAAPGHPADAVAAALAFDGELALLSAFAALCAGIDSDEAWRLALREQGIGATRLMALGGFDAASLTALADGVGPALGWRDPIELTARFAALGEADIEQARAWLRLPVAYRMAVGDGEYPHGHA